MVASIALPDEKRLLIILYNSVFIVSRVIYYPRGRRKSRESNARRSEQTSIICGAFAHGQSGKVSHKNEQ
jgi:hypothetical protein